MVKWNVSMSEKHNCVHVLSKFVRTNGVERWDSIPNYATLLIDLIWGFIPKQKALTEFVIKFQHLHFFYM